LSRLDKHLPHRPHARAFPLAPLRPLQAEKSNRGTGISSKNLAGRTSVVAVVPGAKMTSPAVYCRDVIRRTHAVHFAGGMLRLNRHDTIAAAMRNPSGNPNNLHSKTLDSSDALHKTEIVHGFS